MWNEIEIDRYLKDNLKQSRYEHSLSVSDTAVKLAQHYNGNICKAKLAGLIHDCAKNMREEELLKIAHKCGVVIDRVCESEPELLHGLCSAYIAKNVMKIYDEEVLQSVICHTTGKKNMSLLEKIIYVADYIEPLRDFEGVEELRKAAYEDIDKALLLAFNNTINYVIVCGGLIHLNTIEARNYLIYNKNCR